MNQIGNVQQAETIYYMLNCEWDEAKALMQKLDRMIMGFQKSVRLTDNARYVIAVTIEFEYQYMTDEEKEALKSLGFEKELHEKEIDDIMERTGYDKATAKIEIEKQQVEHELQGIKKRIYALVKPRKITWSQKIDYRELLKENDKLEKKVRELTEQIERKQ